jgi:hypothetical protein
LGLTAAAWTVLYGTKDLEGAFVFQSVPKLVTRLDGKRETTQGTGYFGMQAKSTPISDQIGSIESGKPPRMSFWTRCAAAKELLERTSQPGH